MRILPQEKAVCLNTNPEYFFTLYKISVVSHYFPLFSFDSITWSAIANNAAMQDVLQARPERVAIYDNNKHLTSPLPNETTLDELPEGGATIPNSHEEGIIQEKQEKKGKSADGVELGSDDKITSTSSTSSSEDEGADEGKTLANL